MIDKDYAGQKLQTIGNEVINAEFRYCKDDDTDFEEKREFMLGERLTIVQLTHERECREENSLMDCRIGGWREHSC